MTMTYDSRRRRLCRHCKCDKLVRKSHLPRYIVNRVPLEKRKNEIKKKSERRKNDFMNEIKVDRQRKS